MTKAHPMIRSAPMSQSMIEAISMNESISECLTFFPHRDTFRFGHTDKEDVMPLGSDFEFLLGAYSEIPVREG